MLACSGRLYKMCASRSLSVATFGDLGATTGGSSLEPAGQISAALPALLQNPAPLCFSGAFVPSVTTLWQVVRSLGVGANTARQCPLTIR